MKKPLTKKTMQVFDIIRDNHPISPQELARLYGKGLKTIRVHVKKLISHGLVKKSPNLLHMRSLYYKLV